MHFPYLFAPAALLVAAYAASGAPPVQEQRRGTGASINGFFSDTCSSTSFNLFANEIRFRTTVVGTIQGSSVVVTVSVFNPCTFGATYMAVEGQAVITGNIHTTLRVVANVTGEQRDEVTGATTPVAGTVDVTLTPTEQPVMTRSLSTFANPTVFQRFRSKGLFADATAGGRVVIGGIDYLSAAIVSGTGVFSSVSSSNEGSMQTFK
jgi:hypothetical protein